MFQVMEHPVEATSRASLTLVGMDSPDMKKTKIRIEINGRVVYEGGNPLPNDKSDPDRGNWGSATIPFPTSYLHQGTNQITIDNMARFDGLGSNKPYPWFLLDYAVVTYRAIGV